MTEGETRECREVIYGVGSVCVISTTKPGFKSGKERYDRVSEFFVIKWFQADPLIWRLLIHSFTDYNTELRISSQL